MMPWRFKQNSQPLIPSKKYSAAVMAFIYPYVGNKPWLAVKVSRLLFIAANTLANLADRIYHKNY